MMYEVYSPDGLTQSYPPPAYPTAREAERARDQWVQSYKPQGYYKTGAGERIPFALIAARFTVLQVDPYLEMLRDLGAFVRFALDHGQAPAVIVETVAHDLGLIWSDGKGTHRSAGYYAKYEAGKLA